MANIPIWPGSSSFAQVSASYYNTPSTGSSPTPFGFYDNDTDFKTPQDISCLPFYEKQVAWYDPDKLSSVLKLVPKYDLIIVDGPNGNYGRGGFYTHLNLFNTDAHMVFHDLNRQAEMELIKKVSAKVGRPAFILDDDDKTGVIKSNN